MIGMRTIRFAFSAVLIPLLLSVCVQDVFGWSKTGHSTVGQVAENHLTPKARAALRKYLGVPLAGIASDADAFRAYWTLDLGFIPSNPDDARLKWLKKFDFTTPLNISPWSHSITVDEDFNCFKTDNLDGAYINNAAYYVDRLAAELRDHAEEMSPFERYKAIALITHLIGDMHCPMHIVYLPKNTVKGHINVTYKGKQYILHNIWDLYIVNEFATSFCDMTVLVDTATSEEISEITKGTVYDWASDCGRKCWETCNEHKEGDTLPSTYYYDHRDLLFSQLRNGGYRLAKVFNDIFE